MKAIGEDGVGLREGLHRQLDVVLEELVRRREVGDEQKERGGLNDLRNN